MHVHLNATQDIRGFSPTNVEAGNYFWLLTKDSVTSDQAEFYGYIRQFSAIYLSKAGIFLDAVYQFLVLIHPDLSADLYVNDFVVAVEMMLKRDAQKGAILTDADIADIRAIRFPEVNILDTDRVIYCFKSGWKFGLYFDLGPDKLDLTSMSLSMGKLYRELLFECVYKSVATGKHFDAMKKDGWFPFIELLGGEYQALDEAYQNHFHLQERVGEIVDRFDKARIERIASRWWTKQIFSDKKIILEAGIQAFTSETETGCVNCIKNLLSEVEGIIRLLYVKENRGGSNVKVKELLTFAIQKGKDKTGLVDSLFLPGPFLDYLNTVVFTDFDVEQGKVDLSRNTSAHGVAKPESYTRARALQSILILDQLWFYL